MSEILRCVVCVCVCVCVYILAALVMVVGGAGPVEWVENVGGAAAQGWLWGPSQEPLSGPLSGLDQGQSRGAVQREIDYCYNYNNNTLCTRTPREIFTVYLTKAAHCLNFEQHTHTYMYTLIGLIRM